VVSAHAQVTKLSVWRHGQSLTDSGVCKGCAVDIGMCILVFRAPGVITLAKAGSGPLHGARWDADGKLPCKL